MKILSISYYLWGLKRKCKEVKYNPLKRLYILVYEISQYITGSWISWESTFKGMPCLPHGMQGIFISRDAKIGKNCVIFQQVTIGSNTLVDSENIGSPVIGNDCYIGAGAKIIGNVIIGNNVRIGANCVVHKSVPDNSVVISGKQHIITKQKIDNRFYTFRGKWLYYDNGHWIEENNREIISYLSNRN